MSVIPGTPDPETIPGTPFDDLITAYGGNYTVYAQGGMDTVYGGSGDDSLYGDFGNDLLFGESGNDTLQTGGDSDQLFGGDGNDYIIAGDINYDGQSTAYGGIGDDTISLFGTSHGILHGGDGTDTAMFLTVGDLALTVDLTTQTIDGHGGFPGVTMDGFEALMIHAGAGDDVITGGDLSDRILVGAGANQVHAGGGNDHVGYVTRGASTLDGGAGHDVLAVSGGTSALYFIYDRSDDTIDDGQGSVLTGFEDFIADGSAQNDIASLGRGNDEFHGWAGRDTVFGYDGNDTLLGNWGMDSLSGEKGNDWIYGGFANDSLYGGEGRDFLGGGVGDDLVDGGAGNDRIRVYLGYDTLTGGDGRDTFMFTLNENGVATITDFHPGEDQFMFRGIFLQNGPAAGPLDSSLLSVGQAVGSQAQFVVVYDADQGNTRLLWDTNGADPAGGAYLYAILAGQVTLSASDFVII